MKLNDQNKRYRFKNIEDMSDSERNIYIKTLENWHVKEVNPNCECKPCGPYPKVHVRKSVTGKWFLANNPGNKAERSHSFQCPLNVTGSGYKGYLRGKGIMISDDGQIQCRLKKKRMMKKGGVSKGHVSKKGKPSISSGPSQGENALRYLFLTWLQEVAIHEYHPNGSRKLYGRLKHITEKTKLDSIQLNKDNVYIAQRNGFLPQFARHRIIIAWGNKDLYPGVESNTSKNIMNIPIFSVAQREDRVGELSVFKSVYESATLTNRAVGTGYWVLYRGENDNKKLIDEELIFEPADPETGIPVESSYEAEMVRFLVKRGWRFRKPLVGNVTELFLDHRPDMVLLNSEPVEAIVEVAGYQDEAYREHLEKKKQAYLSRGYLYVEWDGKSDIEALVLPAMKEIPKEYGEKSNDQAR